MTGKIREQIEAVRKSGKTNMLDTQMVQRIAHDMHLYELVAFIEDDRKGYCKLLMGGR